MPIEIVSVSAGLKESSGKPDSLIEIHELAWNLVIYKGCMLPVATHQQGSGYLRLAHGAKCVS
jgi:hypothetical protein